MSSQRKAIRHKLAAVLTGSVDQVGERVAVNRVLPWQHNQLPAIGVYSIGEEQVEDYGTQQLKRRVKFTIEIVVNANSSPVDDTCDDIGEQVEQTLFACPYLDDYLADEIQITDLEGPLLNAEGETLIGVLQINLLAVYLQDQPTDAKTPDQAMKTIHATMDLVDAQNDTPESVDIIDTSAT